MPQQMPTGLDLVQLNVRVESRVAADLTDVAKAKGKSVNYLLAEVIGKLVGRGIDGEIRKKRGAE